MSDDVLSAYSTPQTGSYKGIGGPTSLALKSYRYVEFRDDLYNRIEKFSRPRVWSEAINRFVNDRYFTR